MKTEVIDAEHEPVALARTGSADGLLASAVQQLGKVEAGGAKDVADAIRTLVQLKREDDAIAAKREFFDALNRFHATCPPIPKDQIAKQVSKSSGVERRIPFAPLSTIERVTRPILIPLGFSWRWDTAPVEGGKAITVTCHLMHRGGHQESASMIVAIDPAAPMNATQQLGSTRTYGMRYSLEQVLGLVTTLDLDGNDPEAARSLDEDQIATLEIMLTETGSDRGKFLAYFRVKSVGEITQGDYAKAEKMLKAKAAR